MRVREWTRGNTQVRKRRKYCSNLPTVPIPFSTRVCAHPRNPGRRARAAAGTGYKVEAILRGTEPTRSSNSRCWS